MQAYELAKGVRSQFVTPPIPRVRAFGYGGKRRSPRLPRDLFPATLANKKFGPTGNGYGLEAVILTRLKRSLGDYSMAKRHFCILEAMAAGSVPESVVKDSLGQDADLGDLFAMYERRFGEPGDDHRPSTTTSTWRGGGGGGGGEGRHRGARPATAPGPEAAGSPFTTPVGNAEVDEVAQLTQATLSRVPLGKGSSDRHEWRDTVRSRPSTATVVPDRREQIRAHVDDRMGVMGDRPVTASATVAAVRAAAAKAEAEREEAEAASLTSLHTKAPQRLVGIMMENAKHAHAGYKAHEDAGLTQLRFRKEARTKAPVLSYSGERRKVLSEFPLKPTTIHEEAQKALYKVTALGTPIPPVRSPPKDPEPDSAKLRANPSEYIAVDDLLDILIKPKSTKYEPTAVPVSLE